VSIFWADVGRGDGLHAIFALSNVMALGYGLVAMIGLKEISQDYAYAISGAAKALWRKLVPDSGRAVPEPVAVPGSLQLKVITAELVPPIQAGDPSENMVVGLRRTANKLQQSTALVSATLPEIASGPLQPADQLRPQEDNVPGRRRTI
jgi:hypothetical protein